MAYHIEPQTGDIVIDTFNAGIGSDPYSGLTDMKSVNPTTIPNEVGVSFSGNKGYTAPSLSIITATTASATNNITFTTLTPLEVGQAIYLTNVGSSGLSTSQVYWVSVSSYSGTTNTIGLTTTYGQTGTHQSLSNGTVVFSTFTMTLGLRGQIFKNYIVQSQDGYNWIADSNGFVWSDKIKTSGGTGITNTTSWTYTGNVGAIGPNADPAAYGNGLVYFQPVHPTNNGFDGYLFLFRQQQIDYLKVVNESSSISAASLSWQYNWNPNSAELNLALLWGENVAYSHEAIQTPDGRIVFTDGYVIGYFFQNSVATTFDPTNSATFTYVDTAASTTMPPTDIGISIAYNPNQTLIVGGMKNIAYVFSLTSTPPYQLDSLIQIPENVTNNIVVASNNTYLFSGVRGRIYIANGSQANEFYKVPDHLSGTVQPTFQWGAATTVNNKLCFGIYLSNSQTLTTANTYGGIWMVDITTGADYVANELNTGYQDYACALLAMPNNTPLSSYIGNALIAGWNSPNTFAWGSSGIFASNGLPYTDGNSWIVSDIIPIGTLLKKGTPYQFEFKLTMPLQTSETVQLLAGYSLSDYVNNNMTPIFTTTGDGTLVSDNSSNHSGSTVQNQQWLIVQAILTGKSSNPSYNRLTQLRIIGDTLKTQIPTQPFAL
jgi:hypothetical protein